MKHRLTATLLAFALTACGDDVTTQPDADPDAGDTAGDTLADTLPGDDTSDTAVSDTMTDTMTDTEPSPAIERRDWSTERGTPLAPAVADLSERDLLAAHPDGAVTFADCQTDVGCDFAWLDADATVVATRDDRIAPYGTLVGANADLLYLFDADDVELCGPEGQQATVLDGTLEVIRVASQTVTHTADLRTNVYLDPAFSPGGDWFRTAPLGPADCTTPTETWRSAATPHTVAQLPPDFFVSGQLPDGRLVGWGTTAFGVADPRAANSFRAMGEGVETYLVGDRWLHALDGYGDLTQRVYATGPDKAHHTFDLPTDTDYRGRLAWGRTLVACTQRAASEQLAECFAFDVTQQRDTRRFLYWLPGGSAPLFVGGGDAIVYVGKDDAGAATLARIDLASGADTVLASGPGKLRPIGFGAAALWVSNAGVLLVERHDTAMLVAGPTAQVLTAPQNAGAPASKATVRQRSIAVIVVTTGVGAETLYLFDLDAKRLTTLTERLHFAPTVGQELLADTCGQPWTLRSAGSPVDGFSQDARWFFFVERPEQPGDATLFVMPLDQSTPPRALTAMHPIYCHPPLASPDGSLIAIDVDHDDGQTSRISIVRP